LGPIPADKKKLKGTILFTESIIALLPTSHALAKEEFLTLSQPQHEEVLSFPEGYIVRVMIVEGCQQLGFQPKVAFEGEDIDAIKGLVSAGLGVSLVPEITLVDNLPRASVKIPIIEPNINRTVGVIIPTERQLLPTEKLF